MIMKEDRIQFSFNSTPESMKKLTFIVNFLLNLHKLNVYTLLLVT